MLVYPQFCGSVGGHLVFDHQSEVIFFATFGNNKVGYETRRDSVPTVWEWDRVTTATDLSCFSILLSNISFATNVQKNKKKNNLKI